MLLRSKGGADSSSSQIEAQHSIVVDNNPSTTGEKRKRYSGNDIRLLNSDSRLASGHSTGSILYSVRNSNVTLQVKKGQFGRGLFAACPIPEGVFFASFAFTLSNDAQGLEANEHLLSGYKFAWKKGIEAILHIADSVNLGNLVNTARPSTGTSEKGRPAARATNNCKIVPCVKNKTIRLLSTRSIATGQECLAPYGSLFRLAPPTDPADKYDGEVEIIEWIVLGNKMLRCPQPNCNFSCRKLTEAGGHETMSKCWGGKC
jgi:hypothetical protein